MYYSIEPVFWRLRVKGLNATKSLKIQSTMNFKNLKFTRISSASQPARRPAGQPDDRPVSQTTGQSSRRPASQPDDRPVSQTTGQSARRPASQPASQPARKPASQP